MKTAVLLAAGRGTRLKPYTDTTPKPLLPVLGAPTLDLYFHALQAAGFERAVLVTHHLAEQIEQYAAKVPVRFGMQCATAHQHLLDGTASALEAAEKKLLADDQSTPLGVSQHTSQNTSQNTSKSASFLLMATDYLIQPDFISALVNFHHEHNADVSVSLKRVPAEELASRSSVRFDADDNITEIVEKPKPGEAPSDLGANLAFILPATIFSHLPSVPCSARGEREVQSAINTLLASGGSARGLIQETPSEWTPKLRE